MKSLLLTILLGLLIFACKKNDNNGIDKQQYNSTEDLRINQLQIIASHNSYRLKTYQPIFDYLVGIQNLLPAEYNPNDLDYTHLPIDVQFNDYNIRGLEIDISPDPNGGYYYNRGGNDLVAEPVASGIPQLLQPGFKVFHIADIDYETHHYTFVEVLQVIKQWSDANPNHLPLFINVEAKSSTPGDILPFQNFVKSIPYTAQMCDDIDNEIKTVFGNNLDKVLTPDKVRGSFTTLEEVVLAKKWPKLSDARGKVIFIMQGGMDELYVQGHESLKDRAMFIYATPGTPEAAFVILNGAITDEQEIKQRVQQDYIVRTRSDSGTTQARNGDYSAMNAAFRSGAQIISTDYYKADDRAGQPGWTNYKVNFPNNELARINPISAEGLQELGTIVE